jgi:hypothetical protein
MRVQVAGTPPESGHLRPLRVPSGERPIFVIHYSSLLRRFAIVNQWFENKPALSGQNAKQKSRIWKHDKCSGAGFSEFIDPDLAGVNVVGKWRHESQFGMIWAAGVANFFRAQAA